MENQYTKEDVIQFTINILEKISVPIPAVDSIGVPITKALGNLHVLQQMLEMEQTKQEIQDDPETNIAEEEEDDGQSDPE